MVREQSVVRDRGAVFGNARAGCPDRGLPELVDRMFRSGDVNDFRVQLGKMWDDVFDYRRQTEEAQRRYDAEVYYKHLMEVYS